MSDYQPQNQNKHKLFKTEMTRTDGKLVPTCTVLFLLGNWGRYAFLMCVLHPENGDYMNCDS